MAEFVHLHNHSQYSLLDGAARVDRLIEKAVENKQKAIAITDHGNLFAAPSFYKKAKDSGIKPILGSEFYVTPTSMYEKDTKERYHLILLAKNVTGYKNLIKLSSRSFLDGYYYKPRIDRELLRKHSDGLIALTACIKGEVPNAALKGNMDRARKLVDEYLDIFGENFYLELQNHGIREEIIANNALIDLAREKGVPMVATNDIHYISQGDAAAHDILLCLATGKEYNDPNRMKFTTDQVYFKSSDEMADLFKHLPEAIENTLKIAESVSFDWKFGETHLPDFQLPAHTTGPDDYLRELCIQGVRKRYGEINESLQSRLDMELSVIKRMGYAGYFLITQDFTQAARDMGVSVGPGRGSAAGSLVAYATGITNVDPIRYNLLFERFLNPERISMPDIDIDFDDKGRGKVIDYVVNKYGRESVTQIITFGTMAARGAIRDVGRALGIPLKDVDRIAKMIPEGPDQSIADALEKNPDLKEIEKNGEHSHKQLIEFARVLEGSARHTSMHAAGVVITPGDLTEFVPLHKAANDVITTQYDKDWSEKVGLLKMDFLGLKTLSILNDSVRMVRENHQVEVDLDRLPENDVKTYDMIQRGETVGVFQFESEGMREYLKKLKPTNIEDMIAMNALYRPGPIDNIPSFIKRKHGQETIDCFHTNLEPILKETYGVIVYQEQVMQIAQVLAGFSLGKADVVRRIMAKKKPEELDKIRPEWVNGSVSNGYEKELAERIFDILVPFSNYAFNKSHSAAYAILAYQTAWLKANYPAEFMAACLNSELGSTDKIVFFIHECKRMGLAVLPPDVNESQVGFSVVNGKIRFGMAAVKNVGQHAVESIIAARGEQGGFRSFFDFFRKIDLRLVNKKVLESLVQVGAFDSLPGHRAQKLASIEKAITWAQAQLNAERIGQDSLFDSAPVSGGNRPSNGPEPDFAGSEPWSKKDILAKEKEFLGFYVSGHILDSWQAEFEAYSRDPVNTLNESKMGKTVHVLGQISAVTRKPDKNQRMMAFITLEDFFGTVECLVFSKTYEKLKDLIVEESVVLISGRFDGQTGSDSGKILVDSIETADSLRNRKSKGSVSLQLNLTRLSDSSVEEVWSLLLEHPGDLQVYLEFTGTGIKKPVRALARNIGINMNQDFMDKIQIVLGENAVRYLN